MNTGRSGLGSLRNVRWMYRPKRTGYESPNEEYVIRAGRKGKGTGVLPSRMAYPVHRIVWSPFRTRSYSRNKRCIRKRSHLSTPDRSSERDEWFLKPGASIRKREMVYPTRNVYPKREIVSQTRNIHPEERNGLSTPDRSFRFIFHRKKGRPESLPFPVDEPFT